RRWQRSSAGRSRRSQSFEDSTLIAAPVSSCIGIDIPSTMICSLASSIEWIESPVLDGRMDDALSAQQDLLPLLRSPRVRFESEVLHEGHEEQEHLHASQNLSETRALADSERIQILRRLVLTLRSKEAVRIELVRVGEVSLVMMKAVQVDEDHGIGGDVVATELRVLCKKRLAVVQLLLVLQAGLSLADLGHDLSVAAVLQLRVQRRVNQTPTEGVAAGVDACDVQLPDGLHQLEVKLVELGVLIATEVGEDEPSDHIGHGLADEVSWINQLTFLRPQKVHDLPSLILDVFLRSVSTEPEVLENTKCKASVLLPQSALRANNSGLFEEKPVKEKSVALVVGSSPHDQRQQAEAGNADRARRRLAESSLDTIKQLVMADCKASFLAFCDATKKGSDKASDKTIKKIFTDCKVFPALKMTSNDMDISISSYKGKAKLKGDLDYNNFCAFITHFCAEAATKKKVSDAAKAEADVKKLIADNKPSAHGATAASKDDATSRLTDVKGYTGAHKERFDADTGKGKGKEGREYVADKKAAEGYVGGYKNMDTYNKK
uniref:FH2 domain-containing protein n=2 Tax=Macrostomum lignano TaxID=282301 RepID=A0A1I8GE80_9PLAT